MKRIRYKVQNGVVIMYVCACVCVPACHRHTCVCSCVCICVIACTCAFWYACVCVHILYASVCVRACTHTYSGAVRQLLQVHFEAGVRLLQLGQLSIALLQQPREGADRVAGVSVNLQAHEAQNSMYYRLTSGTPTELRPRMCLNQFHGVKSVHYKIVVYVIVTPIKQTRR